MKRVAIVSLGRDAAKGEIRRVASWRILFEHVGATVEEVRLPMSRLPHFDGVGPLLTGSVVPERLSWSGKHLKQRLARLDPDLVLVVSARAFDPHATTGRWTLVLDLVDSLSRSYRDRADLVPGSTKRLGFRALALAHSRAERRLRRMPVHLVAAGWADAATLDAEWIPVLGDPSLTPPRSSRPDHDILFFGTLRYPPNVDALERLGHLWPLIQRRRPGTSALVAGSAPTTRVQELCTEHGWELLADFASLGDVAARARIAIAPLRRTAGIQIKVLDAACLKLPQVVTTAALDGYAPDFPLDTFDSDEALAAQIAALVENPGLAARQAERTHRHVVEKYSVPSWAVRADELLRGVLGPSATPNLG